MAARDIEARHDRSIRGAWLGPVVSGILLIVLGAFAVSAAPQAGVLSVVMLGLFLLVAGVIEAIHALTHRESANRLLFLLSGILSSVVGVLLVSRAAIGLAAVTLMIAGYFIANGLFHAIAAATDRYEHWGWDFLLAAASIVLGIIVIGQWPVSSLWLVGTVVGIEIIFRGCALMVTGFGLRRLTRGRDQVTA